MGRTVPTWRYRFENELNGLEAYKRALPSSEKAGLEALMNGVRKRRTAGGMLPAHDIWKVMLLSMLLEAWMKIEQLENRLQEMEE